MSKGRRTTSALGRFLVAVLATLVAASGALALGAPAPAGAQEDPPPVVGTWGLRTSYRSYINGPIAHGTTTVADGAAWLPGSGTAQGPFTWPVRSAAFDPATEVGEVAFDGSVSTAGHDYGQGHVLELELSDLRLAIAGDVGTLHADLEFRPFVGVNPATPPPAVQTAQDIAFATLDLSGVTWPATASGELAITAAPATGVPATMALIGWDQFYSAEVPTIALDPFSVTVPATPDPDPEPGTVTGAQLRWGFSRYAHYGVFGAWSQVATGPNVSVTQAEGQSVSGNPEDAGLPFKLGVFDGGTGTIDPETGAGTITWDTGDWVLNAYNGQFGAPDETFRDPILTVAPDGSGTLSFELFIPDAVDMAGNPVPGAGPERKVVATFSSLAELTATSLGATPDFAGRPYYWPPGSGIKVNEDCDGAGGSWPAEYIDFVPSSIQLHYYTSSCSGLNTKKPPLPFSVDWAPADIAITTQPSAPATVDAGTPLPLTVVASGNPAPGYQWQRSGDGGTTWADVDGATGSTYALTPQPGDDGARYRVVLSGTGGPLTSDVIALDVATQPAGITGQPTDQTVAEGAVATFSLATSGKPAPTVVWQRSDDGGTTWADQPAQANPLYHQLTPTFAADHGARFRAVVDNGLGEPITSNAATLSVTTAPPSFPNPSQPTDRTIGDGQLINMYAEVAGAPRPAIQWQRSGDGGTTWADVDGATGDSYQFEASAADDGARYRVVATNPYGGPVTSRAATLTVTTAPPSFSLHPTDRVVGRGETATFTSWPAGQPSPTVQWQRSDDDGATWADIPGAVGIDLRTYTTPPTTDADDGARFRAVATNAHGTLASEAATLDVRFEAPAITGQPADLASFAGYQAQFSVAAEAYPAATHRWESSTDGGETWADVDGATGATLTVTGLTTALTGTRYRAVVANAAGEATSQAATLTVVEPTGARQVLVTPGTDIDPSGAVALQVVGSGFTPPAEVAGNVRLALTDTTAWQPDQAGTLTGAVTSTTLTRASLADEGGRFQRTLTVAAGTLDGAKHYGIATFSQTTSQRFWDSWTPVLLQGQQPPADEAPAITAQPRAQRAFDGGPATFAVGATGRPSPSFQWQVSTDGGTTWADVAGGTTATLTLPEVTSAQDGDRYRAIATNAEGSATSEPAALDVVATTGGPQLLLDPAWVADPAGTTTVRVSGAGYGSASAGVWVVLVPTSAWEARSVDAYEGAAMVWTDVSGPALSGAGGRFSVDLALSGLDPEGSYHLITYSKSFADRSWDAGTPVPFTEPQPEPIAVTGAQLTWGYSQYAQYGVFGPWRMWTQGEGVSIARAEGQATSGDPVDAGRPFNLGVFDGGTGTIDPATGEGTIAWETGEWVINAYPAELGAPDETYADPVLAIGADGSGTLSMVVTIPAHDDFLGGGGQVAQVGPERKVVATFAAVDGLTAAGFSVDPDFAGREYSTPEGSGWQACGGAGGSWPAELIDFLPTSVRPHYYTTSCSGLNLKKPPLPVHVALAPAPVAVTTQPTVPEALPAGGDLGLWVGATGTPAPVVQWERSLDGGTTWAAVEGATGARYPRPAAPGDDGARFRAQLSNGVGEPVATEATGAVAVSSEAPAITYQPQDAIVGRGEQAWFQVFTTGAPPPTVQWQRSDDDGATWADVEGGANGTLILAETTDGDDGAHFRAQVSNGVGEALTSDVATLSVRFDVPTVTAQPADLATWDGLGVQLEAMVEGSPRPTTTWEVSRDGGTTWADVPDSSFWLDEGPTTTRALHDLVPTTADDGALFRVRATSAAGEVRSEPSRLTVLARTGERRVVMVPGEPLDPAAESTVTLLAEGFTPPEDVPGSIRLVLTGADVWQPGQEGSASGHVVSTSMSRGQLEASGGVFARKVTVPSGQLDPAKAYGLATFSTTAAQRHWDTWTPVQVRQPAEPVEVTGAQLSWGYSQYAQYGVFGPWRLWADGANVSVVTREGQSVSGDPADAGRDFNVGVFSGGTGAIDPVTGAGTITWDTGALVVNAYPAELGAPDETYADPVLTIGPDGSGTLSMVVTIPEHADFLGGGGLVPQVGPARTVVATFADVDELTATSMAIGLDFAGRAYAPAEGQSPWEACGGVGGSWPAELIDFLPTSVRPHYYTTSCSGLNLKKPPLPIAVGWGATPVVTTTTLSASPEGTAMAGQVVTLTAAVGPVEASGSVVFHAGATELGSAPVVAGEATLDVATLAVGTHELTAELVPTDPGAFLGSTSPALAYAVTEPGPTVPGAPQGVSAVGGARQATVSWDAPAGDGGSPVAAYRVLDAGGTVVATTAAAVRTATVLGLAPGSTPTFTVVAVNEVGPSAPSAPTAAVAVTELDGPLVDNAPGDPFFDEVNWAVATGVTTGYEDGSFRGTSAVSRQAMAAFLHRLAGSPAFTPPATPSFSDVPPTNPFYAEVEWLKATGITAGRPDGTFGPAEGTTRGAMAAFLYRLAGSPAFTPPAEATFPDVPLGHQFRLEVEWLASTGITTGYADGSFDPARAVSRQAMVAFLYRSTLQLAPPG